MNDIEAKELARSYLGEIIELEICSEQSQGPFGFDSSEEFLFTFRLFGRLSLVSSEYVSVSKATGKVQYLGHWGE